MQPISTDHFNRVAQGRVPINLSFGRVGNLGIAQERHFMHDTIGIAYR